MYENREAEAGEGHPEITENDDCADLCRATERCLAYDFDLNVAPGTAAACWLHYYDALDLEDSSKYDHYDKVYCSQCEGRYHWMYLLDVYITVWLHS